MDDFNTPEYTLNGVDVSLRQGIASESNEFKHQKLCEALGFLLRYKATLDCMIETPVPKGWKLVPIADIKALDVLADAYEDANECDYCSDAYPEHEGCRPDELANKFVRQAKLLSAAPTPEQTEIERG